MSCKKWWEPSDHLKYNRAKRPPVIVLAYINSALEYLRGEVLRGSCNQIRFLHSIESAAQPKINQLDIPLLINEHVLRF